MLVINKGYTETTNVFGDEAPIIAEPIFNSIAPQIFIQKNNTPVVVTSPIANTPIQLPNTTQNISQVIVNGITLQQATDPTNIQIGQFYFNYQTQQLIVNFEGNAATLVYSANATLKIPFSPSVTSQFPDFLANIPIIGKITLSCRLGQHPTGGFSFSSPLAKSLLMNLFSPGGELNFFGAKMRINSPTFTEQKETSYPGGYTKGNVSLTGAWEYRMGQKVFQRIDGSNSVPSNANFSDPECQTSQTSANSSNNSRSIPSIFSAAGIPLTGVALLPLNISNAKKTDTTSPGEVLTQERLYLAGAYVRYSDATGVKVLPFGKGNAWTYQETDILSEIQTNYTANQKPVTAILNTQIQQIDRILLPNTPYVQTSNGYADINPKLSFEYKNSLLTGNFSTANAASSTATQNSSTPRFVQKPPTKKTIVSGDANANQVLPGTTAIKTITMIFDCGGQTRERTTKYYEDETLIWTLDETYGFAATALQMLDTSDESAGSKVNGNPSEFWMLIKSIKTQYSYDSNTGYAIGNVVSGFELARAKSETPETPETLSLTTDNPDYLLYQFQTLTITGGNYKDLQLSPNNDFTQAFTVQKQCNADGTSSQVVVTNPNYVPNYYVAEELTEQFSFMRIVNPDNSSTVTAGTPANPDFVLGSESYFSSATTFNPATYVQVYSNDANGNLITTNGAQLTSANYTTQIKKYNASGQQIGNGKIEVQEQTQDGYPPVAEKRPDQYTQMVPQSSTSATSTNTVQTQQYLVQSPGWSPTDPIDGSENFPLATTFVQAQLGLLTKFKYQNLLNGYSEELTINANTAIKEGDVFNYYNSGFLRQRIVKGWAHDLTLKNIAGQPVVQGTTKLTLGIITNQNLNYTLYNTTPVGNNGVPTSISQFIVAPTGLGFQVQWEALQSKRNF